MTHDERVYHHLYVESKSPLENAECIASLEELVEGLQSENAKLRELCADMLSEDMDQHWPEFTRRALKLGIEVTE